MALLGMTINQGTPGTPDTASAPSNTLGMHTNPSLAGLPGDPKTREHILRERYMKGLKKRKCTVCGNTARARCPFRACKTCCSRARNACSVHVLKTNVKGKPEGNVVHPSYNAPSSQHSEQQQWLAASLQATMGGGFLRPGYSVPSPYNIPTPMGLGLGHPTPVDTSAVVRKYAATSSGARPWAGNPIFEQQEAHRLKTLRIASQKEAYMANAWRLNRYKDFMAAEMWAEDEAFDRYMINSSLLEEVFALKAKPLQGLTALDHLLYPDGKRDTDDVPHGVEALYLDAMRSKFAANSKKREASKLKLKHVIDKALIRLRKPVQDSISDVGDDEESPMPTRRDNKRFKASTEEGKRHMKALERLDLLLQKLGDVKTLESLYEAVGSYRSELREIDDSSSQLVSNDGSRQCGSCEENGSSSERPLAMSGANTGESQVKAGVLGSTNIGLQESPVSSLEHRHLGADVEKLLHKPHTLRRLSMSGLGYWKVLPPEENVLKLYSEVDKTCHTIHQL